MACGILVLQLGIEAVPSKVQTLNHKTTRKVPVLHYSKTRKLNGVIGQMHTEHILPPMFSYGIIFSTIYMSSLEKQGTTLLYHPKYW